jgi:hypothetical protein
MVKFTRSCKLQNIFNAVHLFLGAFAKAQKGTVSFVMSICPSAFMKQLCSCWMDFDKT